MPIERIFLDWNKPFLNSTVQWFMSKAVPQTEHLDLSDFLVLSSVSRASRRLTEKLLFECESRGIGFSPPQILSLSSVFNLLLPAEKIVSETDAILLFLSVIKESGRNALFPSIEDELSELQLLEKARFLNDTYKEITKNGESAEKSIQHVLESGLIVNDASWLALAEMFRAFKVKLRENQLTDSVDALKLLSSKKEKIPDPLVLLATFDIAPVLQKVLLCGFENILSLVFAPQGLNHGFDAAGRLVPEFWLEKDPAINPDRLHICQTDSDQVEYLFDCLRSLPAGSKISDITVGILAEGLDKQIELKAKDFSLPVHMVKSASLLTSQPGQILLRTLHFIASKTFEDLTLLLSLPGFSAGLSSSKTPLEDINKFRETSLQPLVTTELLKSNPIIRAIVEEVLELIQILDLSEASAADWLTACNKYLAIFFAADGRDAAAQIIETLKANLLNLSVKSLSVEAFTACLLDNLRNTEMEEQANSPQSKADSCAIDLVGWLELSFDDAATTFILGLNEGNLPARFQPNALLPDKLRDFLRLETYKTRSARDLYILQSILSSKPGLTLCCAKHSDDSGALLPSSLFLRNNSTERLRVLKSFFKQPGLSRRSGQVSSKSDFLANFSENLLPKKFEWKSPPAFSVSALNDYLHCPYLFYLKHIKKLLPLKPDSRELSAMQFGNLLHQVLMDFGTSAIKDESSESLIGKFLLSKLDYHFRKSFGSEPFPEVLVQFYQMQQRLLRFASWQAEWRNKDWCIDQIELPFGTSGYQINLGEVKFKLSGRIDRIDFNSRYSDYAIFDYKSADFQKSPKDIFSAKAGWKDLQLAAYWLYASEVLNLEVDKLALIVIAAKDSEVSPVYCNATIDELKEAKQLITSLAGDIYNQVFWPPKLTAEKAYDFKSIYLALEEAGAV